MLEIDHTRYGFRTREIWFADEPFDVQDVDGVAFHACTRNVDLPGFSRREFTTPIIDLTRPLDVIRGRMSKMTRRSIARAERKGVVVEVDQGHEEFYELNRRFRARKGLPGNDVSIDLMKRHGTVLLAKADGETLGGKFILKDETHMRQLIGASVRLESGEDRKSLIADANRLLVWKGLHHGAEIGIEQYDLGGYYSGDALDPEMEGINFFKRGFGGEIVVQYIYEKDYSPLYTLARNGYRMLRTIRAIG